MSPAELAILHVLRDGDTLSVRAIAEAADLSERTVRERLPHMQHTAGHVSRTYHQASWRITDLGLGAYQQMAVHLT